MNTTCIKCKDDNNIHAAHCCKKHGCKYGDSNCPVVLGQIEQKYSCEDCNIDDDKSFVSLSEIEKIDSLFTSLKNQEIAIIVSEDQEGRSEKFKNVEELMAIWSKIKQNL